MQVPSKHFLSTFCSKYFIFPFFPSSTQMGAYDLLSMIATQNSLFSNCENDCHIQMHVVYFILKQRNIPYRFMHKHHHQLPGESSLHPSLIPQVSL